MTALATLASVCLSGRYCLKYSHVAAPPEISRSTIRITGMDFTLRRARGSLRPLRSVCSEESSAASMLRLSSLMERTPALDILYCPPSSVTVTLSRQLRGSSLAPAALVIRDVAATSTNAEFPSMDCTAAAFTVPWVTTLDCSTTVVKSFARCWKSSLNWPVELSITRWTSSLALLKSKEVMLTTPCLAPATKFATRWLRSVVS